MEPLYFPAFFKDSAAHILGRLDTQTPWLNEAETRSECFMSPLAPLSYTYGTGRGVRTYTSIPMSPLVSAMMARVNQGLHDVGLGPMNVCFLNRYVGERQHLGWHSDNHPGTDHTRPIVSVSLGQEREIWWRRTPPPRGPDWIFTPTPEIPVERQMLGNGSMFVMPPGMQQTHQHRIPKGDRKMGTRISLTFRAFL